MSTTSLSLHETLVNTINDVVENYIDRIVDKYSLDKAQLQELWLGESAPTAKKASKKNKTARPVDGLIDTEDASDERILKSNKAELAALCKARGIKCTGTKAVLINRLLGKEDGDEEKEEKPKKSSPKTAKKTVKPTESSSSKVVRKMLDSVEENLSIAPIRRNQFNNYEHPETKLVFHAQTKEIIGHQNDDGTIGELTATDINNCKKYKFKYTIPENLSNVSNVKSKVIKEEEDEDVSDEEDDEEEINVVDDDDDSDVSEEDSDVEVDDD